MQLSLLCEARIMLIIQEDINQQTTIYDSHPALEPLATILAEPPLIRLTNNDVILALIDCIIVQ